MGRRTKYCPFAATPRPKRTRPKTREIRVVEQSRMLSAQRRQATAIESGWMFREVMMASGESV